MKRRRSHSVARRLPGDTNLLPGRVIPDGQGGVLAPKL